MGKDGKTLVVTHEETTHTIEKGMPLKETPRLDLYFDNSELTTLLLLSCACMEFICSRKEKYCVLKFTPHTTQQPLPLFHQKQNGQQNQEEGPKKKK